MYVGTRMQVVKELGAQWLLRLFAYMQNGKEIVVNGFRTRDT